MLSKSKLDKKHYIKRGWTIKMIDNKEIISIAQDAIMAYYSMDDAENKDYALAINAGVSEEARTIHKDAIIIDACSFYLEAYNWHLEEAGVTALNFTVPGVLDGVEKAVSSIIDYYEAIKNDTENFMLIETADDIRTAKKMKRLE